MPNLGQGESIKVKKKKLNLSLSLILYPSGAWLTAGKGP
jgi:hypothetical protein